MKDFPMTINIDSEECRNLILGDFYIDQILAENTVQCQVLCTYFQLKQRSKYTTHNKGGILDLVFDDNTNAQLVKWMPTPFSGHFMILCTCPAFSCNCKIERK